MIYQNDISFFKIKNTISSKNIIGFPQNKMILDFFLYMIQLSHCSNTRLSHEDKHAYQLFFQIIVKQLVKKKGENMS